MIGLAYGTRPSELLLGDPIALALDVQAFIAGDGDALNQGAAALIHALKP